MLTKDEFSENFSIAVRGIATIKGIKIKDLEADCCLHNGYLAKIERNHNCINLYTAYMIADYLDIPLDKLIKLAENEVFIMDMCTGKIRLELIKYLNIKGEDKNG